MIHKEAESNKYDVAKELARDRSNLTFMINNPANFSMFSGRQKAVVFSTTVQLEKLDKLIEKVIS